MQVNIRFTEREKVELRRLANDAGLTVSELVRKLVLDNDFRLKVTPYKGLLEELLDDGMGSRW